MVSVAFLKQTNNISTYDKPFYLFCLKNARCFCSTALRSDTLSLQDIFLICKKAVQIFAIKKDGFGVFFPHLCECVVDAICI